MTVKNALILAEERLREIPDPRLDAEYLLAEVLHLSRLALLMDKMRELTPDEEAAFDALLTRREKREPLQYILGNQPFMGFSFKTDARALIPRFDTEILCEEALSHLSGRMHVLDLCTGTGALAIAIKKLRPGCIVTATDLSGDALSLAHENAESLQADIRFLQGDLFAPLEGEKFDLIVSNPPYIPDALRGTLQAEVQKEPDMALFAGMDGLDFYRRIVHEAPRHLHDGGWLCLEIGDDQGESVPALLQDSFRQVRLICDLNGLPRVVVGQIAATKDCGATPHTPAGE